MILVWHFYVQHSVLSLSDGNRIVAEIDTHTKVLTVYNLNNVPAVTISLDTQGKVSGNLNDFQQCKSAGNSLCLTWKKIASSLTLTAQQFKDKEDVMHCVQVSWRVSGSHVMKDCLHLAQQTSPVWLGTHNYIVWHNNSDIESNTVTDPDACVPFVPGSYSTTNPYGKVLKNQGANVIEPLLFSSAGAAVKVSTHHTVKLCRDPLNKTPRLCIEPVLDEAHQDEFHQKSAFELDYVACISDSLPSLYKNVMKQFVKPNPKHLENVKSPFPNLINDGVFFEDQRGSSINVSDLSKQPALVDECKLLVEKPLWNFVYNHPTIDVGKIKHHLAKLQKIGGTCHLQNITQVYEALGDYDLRSDEIFSSQNLLTVVRDLNLDIALPVTPFVNYDARNFGPGARSKYFVYSEETNTPLLTTFVFGEQFYPAIIDVTSGNATEWFYDNVHEFKSMNNVSYFQFYYGQSAWLPHPLYTLSRPLHNIGHFSTLYAEHALRVSKCSVVDVAFDSQMLNQFVLLAPAKNLRQTLSTVLAAGLAGYPFVVANFPSSLSEAVESSNPESYGSLKNGIIRWVELVSFFPVVHIPWDFDAFRKLNVDFSFIINITETCLAIRNGDEIGPELRKAFLEAEINSSKPIIAPMWMAPGALSSKAPDVEKILLIEDQFMIGDNVFVAPVLEMNDLRRTIYFPPGKWKDVVDNIESESENGKWMKSYAVALSRIPVFIRTDDIM